MKTAIISFIRNAFKDQSGQLLPLMALGMVGFLAVGGLTIDVGHAYVVRQQLQNSTNAAGLAAAGNVYNSSTGSLSSAATEADLYSSQASGDENYNSQLGTVTTTITQECLNILLPSGTTCGSSTANNAIRIEQTTEVPTFFMRIFGVNQLLVGAVATASMQGKAQQWNVAIILDATGSMSTADSNCGGVSEFSCATTGVQGLLRTTAPCPNGGGSCTNANANFHVAVFQFPSVSTSTVQYENSCSGSPSTPDFMIYTLPLTTATSYAPLTYKSTGSGTPSFTATYEVTLGASDADANGFVSDYYQPTASNGLNSSSSLVKAMTGCMKPIAAVGTGTGGIPGGTSPGGGVTYYASVLYAAQAALTAEQALQPNTKNAIILLSDGQANSNNSAEFTAPATSWTPNPSGSGLSSWGSTGLYPSLTDECQQAIVAAQAAATAGTRVYTVAYGSEQDGCGVSGSGADVSDTTLVATGKNVAFTLSTLTPCVAMENMASSLDYFFSDYNQSGSGSTCQDASHTVTSLADIFYAISATFTTPRLLPNNAT